MAIVLLLASSSGNRRQMTWGESPESGVFWDQVGLGRMEEPSDFNPHTTKRVVGSRTVVALIR